MVFSDMTFMEIVGSILLPGSLWAIMFSMGLSLTIDDFRRVLTHRRGLYVGVASMLVVPPLIGVAIAFLMAPSPALTVGFILLATCPGGMLSNLGTDLAKGDLALSLSLSIVVSFIYILVVPFYAHFALMHFMDVSTDVQVPLIDFVWKIFSITLIPASIGIAVRAKAPDFALRLKGMVKLVAMIVLLIAFGFILADQIPVLRANFSTLFLMTLLMNLGVLAAAFLVSRGARLTPDQRIAVCIEHLIRQEGTAIYIAVTLIGSAEMSLPMIMNTPVGLTVCVVFVLAAIWFRKRAA